MGIIILNEIDFRGLKATNTYISFPDGIRINKNVRQVEVDCSSNEQGAILRNKMYEVDDTREYYKLVNTKFYHIYGSLRYYASKDEREKNMSFKEREVSVEKATPGSFSDLYDYIKANKEKFDITDFSDDI
tara:strand:- start:36 stop:428 length:393 start_codon:yes stop_codon:yes gene_type:complete